MDDEHFGSSWRSIGGSSSSPRCSPATGGTPKTESARIGRTNYHLARIRLLNDFLESFPEARTALGRWRRVGLAQTYLFAAFFENAHRNRREAVRYAAASLRKSPRGALRGLVRLSR